MQSTTSSVKMKLETLQQYAMPGKIPWTSRKVRIIAVLCGILCLRFFLGALDVKPLQTRLPHALRQQTYLDQNGFQSIPITGFVNTGDLASRTCEDLRHEGELQVHTSLYLEDDLEHIARSLAGHPMIDYSQQEKGLTFRHMVAKTWARLSGSSVWIEKFQVFLTVTRVIFYDNGLRHKPVISFLAGQLHDENWNELKNYTIQWQSEEIKFPTVFNIPAPFKQGDRYFGPEDPRVILEEGVDDAEPIVTFNMLYDLKTGDRAMYIFRPFSNDTTVLTITGQTERAHAEKNWAPFFINEHEPISPGHYKWPSHYIHFIYDFNPLRVLKCHTLNGWCHFVYEQKVPDALKGSGLNANGRMTGGTNMVPLQLETRSNLHAWVGFPRSHINIGCTDDLAMYRPELMIMTAHGDHFYLSFMSGPIDFGTAAMTPEAIGDPCGEGKIVIANSIARWDRRPKHDVLTLTLSVADSTVQIMQLASLSKFVSQLPHVAHLDGVFLADMSTRNKTEWDLRYTAVSKDVLDCTMEVASYYSEIIAAPFKGLSKEELSYENGKWDWKAGAVI
ncbi:glycosyltransferase family 91 protein [Fonsecaea pedrosoi]|nr:glycosyltransferase family 91 protein [Fonsecaea pedrosoi]